MNAEVHDWVAGIVASLPPRRSVVEIGSRNVNGTVRDLFPGADYVGIDLLAGRLVDIVADGATWQPDAPVDTVVCLSTLEHSPAAEAICRNAVAMLEPGGVLILMATVDPYEPHGIDGGRLAEGAHYANIDPAVAAGWLADTCTVDVQTTPTDLLLVTAVKRTVEPTPVAPKSRKAAE